MVINLKSYSVLITKFEYIARYLFLIKIYKYIFFSVRLYETLAMVRIPVFINTDCLLPLPNTIDWKKHMVWVEYDELNKLEDLIIEHYKSLDNKRLNSLFQENRNMWLTHMGMLDFFRNSFIRNEV